MSRQLRWFLVLGLCVAIQAAASDVERPYVKLARFKGDAVGAVSMTFDDAYPSQIKKAVPIFNKHGLRATFFVHTDNVKSSWASTWEAWKEAAAAGHEVGSHTKTHANLVDTRSSRKLRDEIKGSADLIEQRLGIRPISFAYPFSASNDSVERQVREVYLLDRSDCRMWGGQGFGADTGIKSIEKSMKKGDWFSCMMHGVDEVSFRPITSTALDRISEYLAANRDTIWTDTYGNIGRYVRERRHADIRFRDIAETGFQVRLDLDDTLPFRECLVVPLTLMVELDGRDVTLMKAYRGDDQIPLSTSRDGKYALCDVVPDGTWIQFFWGK